MYVSMCRDTLCKLNPVCHRMIAYFSVAVLVLSSPSNILYSQNNSHRDLLFLLLQQNVDHVAGKSMSIQLRWCSLSLFSGWWCLFLHRLVSIFLILLMFYLLVLLWVLGLALVCACSPLPARRHDLQCPFASIAIAKQPESLSANLNNFCFQSY